MNQTADATSILAPLWRRKWLIIIVALLVAVVTYEYYKREPTRYQSSTQLYLGAGAEEQLLEKGAGKVAAPNGGTQSTIINSIVSEAVHKQLRQQHTAVTRGAAKGKVHAKASEKSSFITITAEAHTARASALLANTTAQAYIKREASKRRHAIEAAIAIARRQIRRLETPHASSGKKASGAGGASVIAAATLSSKINQLESQLAVTNVQQIGSAKPKSAVLLAPKPKKNAEFGFIVALILACVAVFALSRFNRRLRSLGEVETAFQMPILAAFPDVKRPIVHEAGRPRPAKALLEPARRLNAALLLGASGLGNGQPRAVRPRSVLFLSADAADGKSTAVAALALVQRDAGENVTVIDADFRRSALARLLDLDDSRGLADVLTGALSLDEAIQEVGHVHAPTGDAPGESGAAVATLAHAVGTLSVLVSGKPVPNPPALLASPMASELLASTSQDSDSVLVDSSPPLEVSDVLALLGVADGIVLVARVGHTRSTSAQRLLQLLAQSPHAPVLGVVANAASSADFRKYGLSTGQSRWMWPARLFAR